MSVKPSVKPRWATSGAIVVPSSGKQDCGWVPGERPPSQYMNFLSKTTYDWITWLDDGDVVFNALSSASLNVTGAVMFGTSLALTGNMTATGRLIATGANASLDLFETTASSERIRLQAPASLSVNQTWTLPSALPTSGVVPLRIDSTGAVTCNQHQMHISAANAQLTSVGLAQNASFDGTAWFLGTSTISAGPVFDAPLTTGLVLSAIKVYINKASASGTITAKFTIRNMATGATVVQGNATNSANNPGSVTLTLTNITTGSLPFTVPDGHSMTVSVDGGGVTGDSVRGVSAYF